MQTESIIHLSLLCLGVGCLLGMMLASIPGYWFKKTFWIDGHALVVRNNLLGIESIYLDGHRVVSRFAFAGTYVVEVGSSSYEVSYYYMWHFLGAGVRLRHLPSGRVIYSER